MWNEKLYSCYVLHVRRNGRLLFFNLVQVNEENVTRTC